MRKTAKAAAVATGIAAVSLLLAQPALANSFSESTQGGTASYTDSSDSFCVHAYNSEGSRWVKAVLKPLNGVGPTVTVYDANNDTGNNCGSLATAYEDTKYRATISAYWGETGTTTTKVVDFWS
jgi:hypothetical protein